MTEDDVKRAIQQHLTKQGFTHVQVQFGTASTDVEGIDPASGRRLKIECKGETNAVNQWDTAWRNAADAVFKALYNTEPLDLAREFDYALAFPDTKNYRSRMQHLQGFCARQRIRVFWVASEGLVSEW